MPNDHTHDDHTDEIDDANDERRAAQQLVVDTLNERIEGLESDKDKLATQLRWMIRTAGAFGSTLMFMLVVFLAVAAGVVRDGELDVPGLGTINVGMSDEAPEPVTEAPEDGGTDG